MKKKRGTKRRSASTRLRGDDFIDRLPPDLKKEIQELRKYEKQVLEALKDQGTADLFRVNPAAALARMKIDLSPVLRKRLAAGIPGQDFLAPRSFLMPNGKRITPRVRVHFTGGEEN